MLRKGDDATVPMPRIAQRRGIRLKFALLVGAVIMVLMVVDAVWNVQIQRGQVANEAREKAEVLADEMHAVWRFIDINQDAVNRAEDGTFRNKQLVCVVAAKSVSTLFTSDTDYTIRFTSPTPRQVSNAPDAFEAEAFAAFGNDSALESYYRIETDAEGGRVFRYAEPLLVTETCLECHGEPVGELDQYGYPKEGMRVGEVAGAISITEPMDIYDEGVFHSVLQQLFMVLLVLVLAGCAIFVGMDRIILKPLDKLRRAAKQIGTGDFDYDLAVKPSGSPDEISDLIADFDLMARQLKDLYETLEEKVRAQTEKLVILNDTLLDQKGMLKRAIDRLNDEILSKNDFFAIVSHELRTPLTSILAYARMLLDGDALDERTRHGLEEIETNGTVLLNLVNNILTISKTEAHKNDLILEPVDFVDLAGFVRNALEPVAKNRNIQLAIAVDADVPVSMADWEKLRRIIENLVDNAIKYTHPGGHVELTVRYDPTGGCFGCDGADECDGETPVYTTIPARDGADGARGRSVVDPQIMRAAVHGSVVIQVSDNGIGIDPEDLEGIFERYRQTSKQSSNRRYKGTGLGLAVVKELTELHGGCVGVSSVRRQGSTFMVCIPCIPVDMEDFDEDTAG